MLVSSLGAMNCGCIVSMKSSDGLAGTIAYDPSYKGVISYYR